MPICNYTSHHSLSLSIYPGFCIYRERNSGKRSKSTLIIQSLPESHQFYSFRNVFLGDVELRSRFKGLLCVDELLSPWNIICEEELGLLCVIETLALWWGSFVS